MSFFPPAIGAGIDIATTAQAQAGTDDTTAISPLKLREGFNASGSAPVFACRAWVNFDGSTTTPTIRASGNVSSVVKNGTGDYTVNFATNMQDANYAFTGSVTGDGFGQVARTLFRRGPSDIKSASSLQIVTTFSTPSSADLSDYEDIAVSVFR